MRRSVALAAVWSVSRGFRSPTRLLARRREESERIEGSEAGLINWYPGHIAKAERQLEDSIRRVDVVVEARDARVARSTAHPSVPAWVGSRPRVVAYTFADAVPPAALSEWRRAEPEAVFLDAKRGKGDLPGLKARVRAAGRAVNDKRQAKGVRPRAARAAVIGFPNVGKSALVNCLCGRRAAKTENRAGVTRSLNWVRAPGFELLDSPGIIPARQMDQRAAARLAMCGDVGAAAYDKTLVAAALLRTIIALPPRYAPHALERLRKRAGDADLSDADAFLQDFADLRYAGDAVNAAMVILADFRNGRLGPVALEEPLSDDADDLIFGQ
ncbi:hypothetical protein CTAYLR_003205 [Chrysophaeum taylorii]|uniref:Mitochondrial GTPase 1 n=1 Tax=Chrysophaeum taylorii TaxID=2483200 RepID=A0AAD7XKJ2_9STRA|nr:hypothetical protein CTAYLR_003205 [Chrysophaeum taylorii]